MTKDNSSQPSVRTLRPAKVRLGLLLVVAVLAALAIYLGWPSSRPQPAPTPSKPAATQPASAASQAVTAATEPEEEDTTTEMAPTQPLPTTQEMMFAQKGAVTQPSHGQTLEQRRKARLARRKARPHPASHPASHPATQTTTTAPATPDAQSAELEKAARVAMAQAQRKQNNTQVLAQRLKDVTSAAMDASVPMAQAITHAKADLAADRSIAQKVQACDQKIKPLAEEAVPLLAVLRSRQAELAARAQSIEASAGNSAVTLAAGQNKPSVPMNLVVTAMAAGDLLTALEQAQQAQSFAADWSKRISSPLQQSDSPAGSSDSSRQNNPSGQIYSTQPNADNNVNLLNAAAGSTVNVGSTALFEDQKKLVESIQNFANGPGKPLLDAQIARRDALAQQARHAAALAAARNQVSLQLFSVGNALAKAAMPPGNVAPAASAPAASRPATAPAKP